MRYNLKAALCRRPSKHGHTNDENDLVFQGAGKTAFSLVMIQAVQGTHAS